MIPELNIDNKSIKSNSSKFCEWAAHVKTRIIGSIIPFKDFLPDYVVEEW